MRLSGRWALVQDSNVNVSDSSGEFTRHLQVELHWALATEAAWEEILHNHLVKQRLARTNGQSV
jgi:predicted HicB family RNase H-like nuclease